MALSHQIRKAREARSLSTTQLAYFLGRSAQTVIAYENGSITPPIPVVRDIAKILETSIGELVTEESS